MPFLNYTTSISAAKTAVEIQARLAKSGAKSVMCEYEGGLPLAISFRAETPQGLLAFRFAVKTDGVFRALSRDKGVQRRFKTRSQAANVAWRLTKQTVDVLLATVEAEAADLAEAFFGYAQFSDGRTTYDVFVDKGLPSLTDQR